MVSSNTKVLPGQQLPASGSSAGKVATTLDEFYKNNGYKTEEQAVDAMHNQQVSQSIDHLNKLTQNPAFLIPLANDLAKTDLTNNLKSSFYSTPQTDNTANIHGRQQAELQVDKGGYLPITQQTLDTYQNSIKNDPVIQRRALKRFAAKNPTQAPQIDQSIYTLDAMHRATTPAAKRLIIDNANEIADGKLKYIPNDDPTKPGRLLQPQTLGESISTASDERDKNIDLFDLADNGTDKDLINVLNADRDDKSNPDKPIPVGNAAGDFIGGNAKVMAGAAAVGWIPVAGEALSGGLFAHEMARTGYANELKRSYSYYKDQGLSDQEALLNAKATASKSMVVDAIVGGTMGAFGKEAGAAKAAGEAATSDAAKTAVANAWKYVKQKGVEGIGEIPQALKLGTVAGGGEAAKNVLADQKGRDVMDGVGDAALNMGALHLVTHAATAIAGKIADKGAIAYKRLMGVLSNVPTEDLKAVTDEQVDKGIITSEEAKSTVQAVQDHKETNALIPDEVKNPAIRSQIQDLITKRIENEQKLQTLDKAFHPALKDKIDGINEQISELANSPEAAQVVPSDEPTKANTENVTGPIEPGKINSSLEFKDDRIIHEGTDIGQGKFSALPDGNIEIDKLYLDKENQKKGFGKKVMEKLFNDNPDTKKLIVYPSPSSEPYWARFADKVDKDGNYEITRDSFAKGLTPAADDNGVPLETPQQKEQPLETNNHKVVYEDGERVAYNKDNEKIPEYVKNKDGKTVKNAKWTNIMNKHADAYNYNFGDKAPDSEHPVTNEQDAASHFIETSNNPAEIAQTYKSLPKEPVPMNSKEQAIAEVGVGKVKASGFYRFDDRNNTNNNLARTYLTGDNHARAMSIDQVAKEVSDHSGQEITPQDIADYMKRFPSGGDPSLPRETEVHAQAKERFQKLTGIPLTDKTATIAIEQLHSKENVAKVVARTEEHPIGANNEPMPEHEVAAWLENESKNHNFEDDATNTFHSEVSSLDHGDAESGSDHQQPSTTPAGTDATETIQSQHDQRPGAVRQAAETGSDKSPESATDSRQKLADDFDRHMAGDESSDKLIPDDEEKKKSATDEYLRKGKAVLSQLFPDHKLVVHDTTEDYVNKEGRSPKSAGVFHPDTKTIALNKELIDKTNSGNTVFHEVIHPIVREALQSRPEAINDAYSRLVALQHEPGMDAVWKHEDMYRDRGTDTMKVEAITEFLSHVADGKIDPTKLSSSISSKIIDVVNRIFKALGIDKVISTPTDLKKLAESIKASFETEDASHVADVMGKDIDRQALKQKSIDDAMKPEIKIGFIGAEDLVNSSDPVEFKGKQAEIKQQFRGLKEIVDCIW